ncbi:MAG TPA: class I SAM-dependent methyltransferase, partial [Rhodothermales bacterium]|nr:class I SAM-dependent methyltransferase [Rhodothermales bacterium]
MKEFWEQEPCGTRYGREGDEDTVDFDRMARERYRLEPHIPGFADFESGRGKEVLEIGVGGGVDFMSWVKAGAQANGIDLTQAAIDMTRLRLRAAGFSDDSFSLSRGDAEG